MGGSGLFLSLLLSLVTARNMAITTMPTEDIMMYQINTFFLKLSWEGDIAWGRRSFSRGRQQASCPAFRVLLLAPLLSDPSVSLWPSLPHAQILAFQSRSSPKARGEDRAWLTMGPRLASLYSAGPVIPKGFGVIHYGWPHLCCFSTAAGSSGF